MRNEPASKSDMEFAIVLLLIICGYLFCGGAGNRKPDPDQPPAEQETRQQDDKSKT